MMTREQLLAVAEEVRQCAVLAQVERIWGSCLLHELLHDRDCGIEPAGLLLELAIVIRGECITMNCDLSPGQVSNVLASFAGRLEDVTQHL